MRAHRRAHTWACAAQNAHGEVRRAILCGSLQGKCRTPSPQEIFCVEFYKKIAGHGVRGLRFVLACAVETHMEPFCVEIYRKNAGPPENTLIQHRAFYSYRKNPFSVATLFGEKRDLNYSIWLPHHFNAWCQLSPPKNSSKLPAKSKKNQINWESSRAQVRCNRSHPGLRFRVSWNLANFVFFSWAKTTLLATHN